MIDSDEGDFMLETAMLKVLSTDILWRIVNDTIQIFGGKAYFSDEPYERMMRDARINMIGEGANDVLRVFTALVGMRDVGLELKGVLDAVKHPFSNLGKLTGFAGRKIESFFASPVVDVHHGELEAEALHVNTCWVSGTFRPDATAALLGINKSEAVLAVTPVGYATPRLSFEEKLLTGFGRTHKRKSLSDLVIGLEQTEWPQWIRAALESARLAPSAVNRQPWRFHVERDSITVAIDSGKLKRELVQSKRLDCGIAMLHIEAAAVHHGVRGSWRFFNPPLVARFTVVGKAA